VFVVEFSSAIGFIGSIQLEQRGSFSQLRSASDAQATKINFFIMYNFNLNTADCTRGNKTLRFFSLQRG
jgi:hypothetical protein